MYRYDDEILEADPPHAYARLEGQACGCASRYYGGDCAHTLELEYELGGLEEIAAAAAAERDRPIVTESELRLLDGNR